MARKVFVSSDMSNDERLIELSEQSPQAALIWPWILTSFDDWGRAVASSKRLKASIFPMIETVTPEIIDESLQLYGNHGLIILYEIDGKKYMAIPPEKWWKYQTHIRGSKREKDESKLPAPASCAQLRADDASGEHLHEEARKNTPSPSLSPSPSPSEKPTTATAPTSEGIELIEPIEPIIEDDGVREPAHPEYKTINEAHTKVIGTAIISPMYGDFYSKLLKRGESEAYIIELLLEMGESAQKPSLRYLGEVEQSWSGQGIKTREQAKQRKKATAPTGAGRSRYPPRNSNQRPVIPVTSRQTEKKSASEEDLERIREKAKKLSGG
ncbi:DnaD domain protein [Paenibacillus thermotolerans]|uniref:DnaD domain-containing protein n=1 Tax=Paenibacillus thermotolerans TaxID=3027807 RepID=UPI002367A2F3|nr:MULTISPECIES: DnaD domain protein [unclassified Paenibacillus]